MFIKEISAEKLKVDFYSILLSFFNLLTLILVYSQSLEIAHQSKQISKLLLEQNVLESKLKTFEKTSIPTPPFLVIKENAASTPPHILKYVAILVLILLSLYCLHFLYVKLVSFSLSSLLPSIKIPTKLLAFIKKNTFMECVLGDFTIRITTEGDTITTVTAKHLYDDIYKPLEEILQNTTSRQQLAIKATEVLQNIEAEMLSNSDVTHTLTAVDSIQQVLNTI